METRPILLLVALLASAASASDIYKWVDEDGVIHFSDQPREGAERVELQPANVVRPPVRPVQRTDEDAEPQPAAPFRYEKLEVVSPAAEETLWNIEGVLNVSLALTPGLQEGHQVRVYHNGEPQIVSGTSFQLQEVWRGVHNLQAEVIDANGQMVIRSQPNRFYVQQSTVNF
ncbi:MAG: DUF4124 domain-containing protein [Woeseiaceae bacterium]|nr:DUF4124 domain-containing protein [Woeseiaceae bacterium]